MTSNALFLDFHHRTKPEVQAAVRANALFVYAKLVAGGMSVETAKEAVEKIFDDGFNTGYETGYDVGRDA